MRPDGEVTVGEVPRDYTDVERPHSHRPSAEAEPPPAARDLSAVPPAKGKEAEKVAVFIAHGMGQQVPFETIDSVARMLRDAALEAHSEYWTGHTLADTLYDAVTQQRPQANTDRP
jgi:hypothetical protein